MALKRAFDEIINAIGDCPQSYRTDGEDGKHDSSSLSKQDYCGGSQRMLKHRRKRAPQNERSIPKKCRSEDQPISLSSLKDFDTPPNFLSLGSGDSCFLSKQALDRVQVSLAGLLARLRPDSCYVMRPGVPEDIWEPNTELTLLYSGVRKVYDSFPADQASATMISAGAGSSLCSAQILRSPSNETIALLPDNVSPKAASRGSASIVKEETASCGSSSEMLTTSVSLIAPRSTYSAEIKQRSVCGGTRSSLPLARRASLARFLENRKERVQTCTRCLGSTRLGQSMPAIAGDSISRPS